MSMLKRLTKESFCYDKYMPKIPKDAASNQILYVLIVVSLLLSGLYIIFSEAIIEFIPVTPNDIGLAILVICSPLLILSVIESYALTKRFTIKNAAPYVSAFIFCVLYIVIAFINVAVLVASGTLA